MRYEWEPKHIQFRVYDDDEPDHYKALCQIYQYGDRAFVDSMLGDDLLVGLAESLPKLKEEYGFSSLEGYTLNDIGRACSILARHYGMNVDFGRKITHGGREFIWLVISLGESKDAP